MASLFLDPLCCQEDHWDVVEHFAEPPISTALASAPTVDDDGEWSEFLTSLLSREAQLNVEENQEYISTRAAAGRWAARARAANGFSAATLLLAMNYLDRCFAGGGGDDSALKLCRDRPWMGRLAAVACVSIAAKIEETWVPHPLDLQASVAVDGDGDGPAATGDQEYFFEVKTIRRMELLLLSALQWRMNSVTPITLIHHLVPKLLPKLSTNGGLNCLYGYLLKSSESALLAALLDWRWVKHKPSVWATAALLYAAAGCGVAAIEIEDTRRYLLSLLNIAKEKFEECYNLISETMSNVDGNGGLSFSSLENKRKNNGSINSCYCYNGSNATSNSYPESPDRVLSSCFSCESSSSSISGDIWPCSVTSSPRHRLYKKARSMDIK